MTTREECFCGAYPADEECPECGGMAYRRDPASIQGIWYGCGDCDHIYLVIDCCECEEVTT